MSVLDSAAPFIEHTSTREVTRDAAKFDGTELNLVRSWLIALRDRSAGVVNVAEYGSNLAAFQAAAAKALASGATLYIPPTVAPAWEGFTNYYTLTGPLDLTGIKNVVFEARLKFTGSESVHLTLGTDSTNHNAKANFQISGVAVSGTGSTSAATGILLKNIRNSSVEILSAQDCETGIVLYAADGNYAAHNTIAIQDVIGCAHGLVLDSAGDGWINENLFLAGNISAASSRTGLVGIWLKGAGYRHNQNTFLKPSLQSWTETAIRIDRGAHNSFIEIRNEASAKVVEFNNDSELNRVTVLGGSLFSSAEVTHNTVGINFVSDLAGPIFQPIFAHDFREAWNDGSHVHVPGYDIMGAFGMAAHDYRMAAVDAEINADGSLELKWDAKVGGVIDTTTVKHFALTVNQPSGATKAIPVIQCYGADGAILSGTSPYYVSSGTAAPNLLASSGSNYERTGGGKINDIRWLVFRPEVKRAFVGVKETTGIFGFQLYAVGNIEAQSSGYTIPYSSAYPLELPGSKQAAAKPTTLDFPAGTVIRNVDGATISTAASWVLAKRTTTLGTAITGTNGAFELGTFGDLAVGDLVRILAADGSTIIDTYIEAVFPDLTPPVAYTHTSFTAPLGSPVILGRWIAK